MTANRVLAVFAAVAAVLALGGVAYLIGTQRTSAAARARPSAAATATSPAPAVCIDRATAVAAWTDAESAFTNMNELPTYDIAGITQDLSTAAADYLVIADATRADPVISADARAVATHSHNEITAFNHGRMGITYREGVAADAARQAYTTDSNNTTVPLCDITTGA